MNYEQNEIHVSCALLQGILFGGSPGEHQNQTYTDFKVLVSDDCSPENLKPIYEKVCGNDPRFAFRRNEANMGGKSLVSHWNLLVDLCDTEYLIMASDDDVYEPKFLEEIDALVEKYPKVDILRAKARRVENGKQVLTDEAIPEMQNQSDFLQYFGVKEMVLCLANYVFKTNALKRMKCFPDFLQQLLVIVQLQSI